MPNPGPEVTSPWYTEGGLAIINNSLTFHRITLRGTGQFKGLRRSMFRGPHRGRPWCPSPSVQQLDRITLCQYTFHKHGAIHAGKRIMCLGNYAQEVRVVFAGNGVEGNHLTA